MKDRRMRLLAAVTVLCAAVAVIAGTAGALPQALPQPAAAPVPAACYTLREYEGGIAVFFGSADLPALRFDIPVYTLPAADQALLQRGITVETQEEFQQLIEDYTS